MVRERTAGARVLSKKNGVADTDAPTKTDYTEEAEEDVSVEDLEYAYDSELELLVEDRFDLTGGVGEIKWR